MRVKFILVYYLYVIMNHHFLNEKGKGLNEKKMENGILGGIFFLDWKEKILV